MVEELQENSWDRLLGQTTAEPITAITPEESTGSWDRLIQQDTKLYDTEVRQAKAREIEAKAFSSIKSGGLSLVGSTAYVPKMMNNLMGMYANKALELFGLESSGPEEMQAILARTKYQAESGGETDWIVPEYGAKMMQHARELSSSQYYDNTIEGYIKDGDLDKAGSKLFYTALEQVPQMGGVLLASWASAGSLSLPLLSLSAGGAKYAELSEDPKLSEIQKSLSAGGTAVFEAVTEGLTTIPMLDEIAGKFGKEVAKDTVVAFLKRAAINTGKETRGEVLNQIAGNITDKVLNIKDTQGNLPNWNDGLVDTALVSAFAFSPMVAVDAKLSLKWESMEQKQKLYRQSFEKTEDGGIVFKPGAEITRANTATLLESKLTKRESEQSMIMIDEMAKVKGISSDQLLQQMFTSKEDANTMALNVGQKDGPVNILGGGQSYLKLFENTNVDDVMQAFSLAAFQFLDETQMDSVATWAGVKTESLELAKENPNKLTPEQQADVITIQEKWSKGFIKYLRTGDAPNTRLKRSFETHRRWLRRLYVKLEDSPLAGINLKQVKPIYDELFVNPDERYSGEIHLEDGKTYAVEKTGEDATIRVEDPADAGKTLRVKVDNLITGNKRARFTKEALKEQVSILGKNAVWESPYLEQSRLTRELTDIDLTTEVEVRDIENMSRPEMNVLAGKLGVVQPSTRKTDVLGSMILQLSQNRADLSKREAARLGIDDRGIVERLSGPFKGENVAKLAFESYIFPLLKRVRTSGGKGFVQEQEYSKGRKATDLTRKLAGELRPVRDKVLKLTRGSLKPGAKTNKVRTELSEVGWGEVAGNSKFSLGAEGKVDLSDYTKEGQEVLKAWQNLVIETGKMSERQGLQVRVPVDIVQEDGSIKKGFKLEPFKATESGLKMMRTFTPETWALLSMQNPALRERLAEALAEVNPDMNVETALKLVNKASKSNYTSPVNMEILREFKNFPTHMKTADGHVIEILESDPFYAAANLVDKLTARLGFISEYGQDQRIVDKAQKDFELAGGHSQDHIRMIRALNGMRIDDVKTGRFYDSINTPGTLLYNTLAVSRAYSRMWKAGKLSKSAIRNTFETAATLPAYGGSREWVRMWKNMLSGDLASYQEHAVRAANVANNISNYIVKSKESGTPIDKVVEGLSGLSRVGANLWLKVTAASPVNTANEVVSVAMGVEMAETLIAGRGTNRYRTRLKLMGFTQSEVEVLMNARELIPLHEAIISRMPTITQGTNALKAEQSVWANKTYAGDIIAFDSYFRKTMLNFYEAAEALYEVRGKRGTVREKFDAAKTLTELTVGHAVVGAVATGAVQLLSRGTKSLLWADWDSENDGSLDDWINLLQDGFVNAVFGGPGSYVAYSLNQGDSLAEATSKAVLPVTIFNELDDFFRKKNAYKDLTTADRFKKAMQNWTTLSGPMANWAAIISNNEMQDALNFSNTEYYRWAKKNKVNISSTVSDATDPTKVLEEEHERDEVFRIHMNKAYRLISKDGGSKDKISTCLKRALDLGSADKDKMINSITSRKKLNKLSAQELISFSKAVNPKVLETLKMQDEVLDTWAEAIKSVR